MVGSAHRWPSSSEAGRLAQYDILEDLWEYNLTRRQKYAIHFSIDVMGVPPLQGLAYHVWGRSVARPAFHLWAHGEFISASLGFTKPARLISWIKIVLFSWCRWRSIFPVEAPPGHHTTLRVLFSSFPQGLVKRFMNAGSVTGTKPSELVA
jgi:hypothetical protein